MLLQTIVQTSSTGESPPFSSSKFYVLQLLPILQFRTILQLDSIVILTLCEKPAQHTDSERNKSRNCSHGLTNPIVE